MATVYIQTGDIEIAVPVREAVSADGHDVEMVETTAELEATFRPESEDTALIITEPPHSRNAARLISVFNGHIPRPPILAFEEPDHGVDPGHLWQGPDEYLESPPEATEVQVVLQEQLSRYRLQVETGIVGRTEAIREVLSRIELIAPVNSTVLITGESGTGKELVARAIHGLSPRRARPFIALNAGAIPETLLESELFGHEKGAFTGATSRRKGMFELADGARSSSTRSRRCRSRSRPACCACWRPAGSCASGATSRSGWTSASSPPPTATSAPPSSEASSDGTCTIGSTSCTWSSLRSDTASPTSRFWCGSSLKEISTTHEREFRGLAPEAMEILLEYDWPGNVRELRNLVESMVVLAPGDVIRAEDIPAEIRYGSARAPLTLRGMETDGVEPGAAVVPVDSSRLDTVQPQLEFIFRTLVDMKIDLEDLRGEFDRFLKRGGTAAPGDAPVVAREPIVIDAGSDPGDIPQLDGPAPEEGEVIRFDPDMTMSDLEREAIRLTLAAVGGNRRKAAERLQIGERTLYRKLREYGIEG